MIGWFKRLVGLDAKATPSGDPSPPSLAPVGARHAPHEPMGITRLRDALRRAHEARHDAATDARREAVAALIELTATPHERAALALVRDEARASAVDEGTLTAAAGLHLQRGEVGEALALLQGVGGVEGLAVRADAHAAAGDLAEACADLERALAIDVAAVGVRDQLVRLRAVMGEIAGERAPDASALEGATLFAPPTTSGFRVLAEAGRGGAAVVYRADDPALGREVALKVFHDAAKRRELVEREARATAALAGVGVVRLYDADVGAGWLALEWASGGSLRDAIERGDVARLAPASTWLAPLVQALARLHVLGWAHGDLKPGNVLFGADGAVLLSDLGMVRRPGHPDLGGTPGYLSPERLAGQPASLADDVYALGCLLDAALAITGEQGRARALADLWRSDRRPSSALQIASALD